MQTASAVNVRFCQQMREIRIVSAITINFKQ